MNSTPDEFVNCASVLLTDTQLDAERLQKDSTARPHIQNLILRRLCASELLSGRARGTHAERNRHGMDSPGSTVAGRRQGESVGARWS